jgi:hypothetical protein
MGKRKPKFKLVALLPPKGPPTNVRPGGAHRDRRDVGRSLVKAELRKFEPE